MKLVVGCGYLGIRVARRWLAEGAEVYAVTRSAERAEALRHEGLRPIVADVTRPETLAGLPPAETVLYSVSYDPQGAASRWDVYPHGLRAVLDALGQSTRRIVFTSSTGVYGQTDGTWVDEGSPCLPTREAGRAMLAAEEVLEGHRLAGRGIVLRLAGLYGPGRITRLRDLLAGRPIAAPPRAFLNLIHVDDAAGVVQAAETCRRVPRTYVVSDGSPVERDEFYRWLSDLLGCPPPQFTEPTPESLAQSRSSTDKRVRNRRMLEELGVTLRYPTYREGLAAAVASGELGVVS